MDIAAQRLSPESWIEMIFSAQAVARGGVVRRSAAWVAREVGRERFEREVAARGFHLIECGGQLIFLCNQGGLRLIF